MKKRRDSKYNTKKTHCKNGHEFSIKNTRFFKNERICRACSNLASIRYRKKRELRLCQTL